jgi:hypothetical protein
VEEQGLSFFFLRFVTTVPRLEHAPLEVEISPLLGSVLLHAPVRDAAISVGLAARSNVTRDRSLRLVAKEKYAAAISSVRVAVENPQQANPDQTLKLIIMLGLYEVRPSYDCPFPISPLYIGANWSLLDGELLIQAT